jgi:glutathione synthase
MDILWVCDSWKQIANVSETTIRFLEESQSFGHTNWCCLESDISYLHNAISVKVSRVMALTRTIRSIKSNVSAAKLMPLETFQYVFLRVDPPFQDSYKAQLQLLHTQSLSNLKTSFVNNPLTLLTVNSKLICTNFKGLIPETIITCDESLIRDFCNEKKNVVLKTINSSLSRSVKILQFQSARQRAESYKRLIRVSNFFQIPIVLQEYIEHNKFSEIRAWFSNGELIEVGKKNVPKNRPIFVPNNRIRITPYVKNRREISALDSIQEFLIQEKIRLAAVDLIDGNILDLNVSSPGLVVEFEKAFKKNLAREIFQKCINKGSK